MTPSVYYNEIDPFAAAWLTSLIHHGYLPDGYVDTRPIQEVQPDDLLGYQQCHFFAGIGGWAYALGLAGWPADRPVWTGSCPCQPFSAAGAGKGVADPRHLWPDWFRLIAQCRPPVVFGEQVEAAIRHGWWDLVQRDLEGENYACGMAVLGAHSVGAPHLRQRCWFVAESDGGEPGDVGVQRGGRYRQQPEDQASRGIVAESQRAGWGEGWSGAGRGSVTGDGGGGMADPQGEQYHGSGDHGHGWGQPADSRRMAVPQRGGRPGPGVHLPERGPLQAVPVPAGTGAAGGLGFALQHGSQGGSRKAVLGAWWRVEGAQVGQRSRTPWSDADWLPCRDQKQRPTQPGLFPLAHGVPNRVGLLRGAGNAIVPQVAQAFIKTYLEDLRGDRV